MSERLGTIYVELDLDYSKFEKGQQKILSEAKSTSLSVEKNWKILGEKSDIIYKAMANGAINAYNMISNRANTSAAEQFRAQSAMVAKINALNMSMTKNSLYETLGVRSVAAIEAQKAAVISSYETIKKSGVATSQDLINIERAKNLKLKELNKEMVGDHEMSMAAMMRAVLRLYAVYYVVSQAVSMIFKPFEKGFLAVDTYNQSVASLAAMVVTFSERQKGMDLSGQWEEALRYSKQMVPVLETIAAKTLLSGQETTALANAFARQGVFLQASNEKQIEAFTRLSNALPLMTQGQEIMRQINTEVRSLMTGSNAASSMLLQTLKAIDPEIKKHLETWRRQGTVMEHIGDMLKGFGPATSLLEVQWQAVKSTLDTTVTQILRGGMEEAYIDIIALVRELNKYLVENKDTIITGIRDGWIEIKKAVEDVAPIAKDVYAIFYAIWEVSGWLEKHINKAVDNYSLVEQYEKSILEAQKELEKSWERHPIVGAEEHNIKARVEAIAKALKETADFDFKPITGQSSEEMEAAKQAERARKSALQSMLDDTIKNNELIDGAGKSQYEKDVARINAQAALYYSKTKDMVAVNTWKVGAMAVVEEKETQRKLDVAAKATEDYKQLMLDESAFSVDQHTNAVNQILLEEQRKIEGIKRLQEEGGITSDQAVSATDIVKSNTLEKLAEEDAAMLQEKADFYSELSGYEEKYRDLVYEMIDAEAKYRAKAYKDDVAAAKWARDQKKKFELDALQVKIEAVGEGLGAMGSAFETISQMYDEDSKQREKLHKVAMVFYAAEKAAALAALVVEMAKAVATQGGGDPYTAFARIAAMIALMASIAATVGTSFGGGSSSSSSSSYTGTVLGGEAGDVSESVANSYELLKDTYSMEYRELTNIYHEMQSLNQNISGLVDEIFRSGGSDYSLGIKNTKALDAGGSFVASTIRSWTNFNNILSFGNNNWGQIAMGGLGFLNNAIAKFTGSLLQSIWGHDVSEKVTGSGVRITDTKISDLMAGQNIVGYDWAKIKKTVGGGWFHGDETSYRTVQQLMGEAITNLFTKIYSNLGTTMVELSTSFGTDINAAMDYTFGELKLNLRKKSAEKINELISAKISEMGDIAAKALFGDLIGQYQQIGEGMLETATRLVTDKAVVAEILNMTGQSTNFVTGEFTKTRHVVTDEWLAWEKLSAKKQAKVAEPTKFIEEFYTATITAMEQTIAFSEALITLAGSLEELQDISATYSDKFFSDEEKQLRLQTQLQGAMEDINQALPDTRAGYRAIVEGLDLTTDAGKMAYITMLQLSEAADQYYGVLEDALQEATDSQDAYIESLKELSKTIDEWLANLTLSDVSPVGSEAAWRAEYTKQLTAATAEGAEAGTVTDFLNYATKFLQYEKTYGTDLSYQAIYDAVVADVMAIRALTNTKIAAYASGGLTSGLSIAGERGREWIVPTYEPQRSSFLKDVGVDSEAIGKAIARHIGTGSGGDVHVSIQIDGREIGNVVARQMKTNGDLQTSVRRLAA